MAGQADYLRCAGKRDYCGKRAISRRISKTVGAKTHSFADVLFPRLYGYANRECVWTEQKHSELLEICGTKTVEKGMGEIKK